jgi:hypothetical protein
VLVFGPWFDKTSAGMASAIPFFVSVFLLNQTNMEQKIKGFKGFDQNLKCRDFQYEQNKSFEMDGDVKACERGFHFCEHPLDVFGYYPPASSRYAEVEGSGKVSRDGSDSKVATSKLFVGVELKFKALIEAAIKFTFDRANWQEGPSATGTRGAASATGDQGAASATGYQGAASATGYQGAASATGDQGAASATGTRGAASATGDQGAASATGTRGAASATGTRGAASATGYQGAASATGTRGAASATGTRGAAVALGVQGKAKAKTGGFITIAEWKQDENYNWQRIDVRSVKVDGVDIKEDVYYQLIDGQFVIAE